MASSPICCKSSRCGCADIPRVMESGAAHHRLRSLALASACSSQARARPAGSARAGGARKSACCGRRATVTGLAPAGPRERCRPPIALRGHLGVQVSAPVSVAELDVSLHAATCASAEDARGREAPVRYALRPSTGLPWRPRHTVTRCVMRRPLIVFVSAIAHTQVNKRERK